MHHTKDKGDIAVAEVIADLTRKGVVVFVPAVSEHLPFDLVAYKDGRLLRIQCKYSSSGNVSAGTNWADRHGSHKRMYTADDFDYYAVYLPDVSKVVYPSIEFAGCYISVEVPKSATPFYWYEDFLEFTDNASKHSCVEFGITPIGNANLKRGVARKIERPTKEILLKQIQQLGYCGTGRIYDVSDNAIRKWLKAYGGVA